MLAPIVLNFQHGEPGWPKRDEVIIAGLAAGQAGGAGAVEMSAPPGAVNGYPLEYRAQAGSYRLYFSYSGPGMHHCRYTPETKWHCTGYR